MVIYEVTLRVERAIAGEVRAWLPGHVRKMLALDGFEGADAFEVVENPPDADHLQLFVHYRLRDAAALDAYLREHAAAMRADTTRMFGERVRASRRVLQPLAG
jgi:quinol monooxygenase YgiN